MSVSIEIHTPGVPVKLVSFAEPAKFYIGRNPDCACCLKGDDLVSRKHAVLIINPPNISIRDLKSTNGLTLNGTKRGGPAGNAVLEPVPLATGHEVGIGKTIIRVVVSEEVSFSPMETQEIARQSIPVIAPPKAGQNPFRVGGEQLLPKVPGYTILRVIGTGGMGSVYLAEAEGTGVKAAIKLMAGAMAPSKKMVESFKREIEVTKAVEHPNIVRFIDAGVTDTNRLYLAIEYVGGGDMAGYIKKRGCTR